MIGDKYEKVIDKGIENDLDNLEGLAVKHMWHKIKTLIINAAKETCGVSIINKDKKRTAWWDDEIEIRV